MKYWDIKVGPKRTKIKVIFYDRERDYLIAVLNDKLGARPSVWRTK